MFVINLRGPACQVQFKTTMTIAMIEVMRLWFTMPYDTTTPVSIPLSRPPQDTLILGIKSAKAGGVDTGFNSARTKAVLYPAQPVIEPGTGPGTVSFDGPPPIIDPDNEDEVAGYLFPECLFFFPVQYSSPAAWGGAGPALPSVQGIRVVAENTTRQQRYFDKQLIIPAGGVLEFHLYSTYGQIYTGGVAPPTGPYAATVNDPMWAGGPLDVNPATGAYTVPSPVRIHLEMSVYGPNS